MLDQHCWVMLRSNVAIVWRGLMVIVTWCTSSRRGEKVKENSNS